MALVAKTFQLQPPLDGQTIVLGNYSFENGELTITAPDDEMRLHAQFLERNWQVIEKANDLLTPAKSKQEKVEPAVVSEADVAKVALLDKLKAGIATLDVENDDHWTADGKPSISVMSQLTGVHTLKRKDLDENFPEATRNAAKTSTTSP